MHRKCPMCCFGVWKNGRYDRQLWTGHHRMQLLPGAFCEHRITYIPACINKSFARVEFLIFIRKLQWLHCSLLWRHNGRDGISNHQPHDCLLNDLSMRRSKKTSELRVTGLCAVNSPGTGEFPAQMASNAENVSMWWRHHVKFDNG